MTSHCHDGRQIKRPLRIQPRFPQHIVKCDNQQRSEQAVGNVKSTTTSATTIKPISRSYGRRSLTSRVQQPSDVKKQAASEPIGVIWLMSFPNSGTSYTLHSIRELTNTTTATNYGLEGDIKDEESQPVFKGDDGLEGPFLELIPDRTTNLPQLIITKTHCGGFSTSHKPSSYIETPRSFLKACLKGKKGVYSEEYDAYVTHTVHYKPDLVKKAIHVFRNPLDNVVARFHLERKRFTAKKDTQWVNEFPNNKLGFNKWCQSIDFDSRKLAHSRWVDDDLVATFPICHAEFFRYVQWHNLAFATTMLELDIPTMVFFYEDYSARFDDVTQELMDFLELEPVGDPEPFKTGKKYSDYYTKEQVENVKLFIKEYANKETWKHLAHYFREDVEYVNRKSIVAQ